MAYFHCTLHGQNFTQTVSNRKSEVNFYTMRWVEADSPAEAARRAVELVSRQVEETGIERGADFKATLEVEKVKEVDAACFNPEFGAFIFY